MTQKTTRPTRSSAGIPAGPLNDARPAPRHRCRWVHGAALIILVAAGLFAACTKHPPDSSGVVLIRVRNSQVTVGQFKRYLEYSDEYLPEEGATPEGKQDLLLQRLNQLTEELILKERAAELGISVSEEEVEKAVDDIKADYPDATFEQALLENAVSYKVWRERLKTRLLMEKVIAEELESKVEITPGDISAYYQAHRSESEGEVAEGQQSNGQGDMDEVIVRQLRKAKAQEAYKDWIQSLQQAYKVEINWEAFKKLTLP
jgi:FKBP-type peptidyl-prolyl cis-trans isomerase (trigger factor)